MSVFDPNLIHPKAPHHFSYGGLNRNDEARRDSGLIKRLLAQLETRYIIVWKGLNLFKSDITALKSIKWLTIEAVSSFLDEAICIYLGKDRSQVEYVCLDISKYPEDKLGPLTANGQFGDLRDADPSISGDDGSILAYAKAMCHWHAHSEYCSVCGSFTLSNEAGHTRKCSNVDCAVVHFPRTDPAVIVAVTFEDKILLGRQAIWPKGMFSVLAGFVEPGETLEHAVAREVYEEAGVIKTNVSYQHCQPWPFPASLMVGFRAEAVSSKLTVNTQEIEMAKWHSREEIAKFDGVTMYLPRKLSISRRLIEEWLYEV